MGLSQEEILLSLVQGVKGKAWAIDREGWDINYTNGVCYWEGIQCDPVDKTTVVGINLPGVELSVTIPSTLGSLTTLREISMPQNILHGTIPSEIAELPHLETLDLSENRLTGSIPIFSSPMLKVLEIAYNELTGTIPSDIGDRHNRLQVFNALSNKISGEIPASFATISSLDTLTLSENHLSGTIPRNLGSAKTLRYLYLDNNYLMGTIPATIARMDSSLAELWLQENLLSGTIPTSLSDVENLFNFYIDGNKFTGSIPKELCRSDLNADFFEEAPDDVARNYCESVACPVGQVSYEGVYPCHSCENEYFNPYLGRVGQCIDLNQRDILQILYDEMGGEEWTGISVGWDKDSDYFCSFTGITCDNNHNVISLDLKGKNLRGQIPEEIGFLRYLEKLDLSDNRLTGYIPSDLRWAPLSKLDVTGNRIGGIVPPMLCLKGGINDNGTTGKFGCEKIACPVGTWSPTGTGSLSSDGDACEPCEQGVFLGSKYCPVYEKHSTGGSDDISGAGIFGIFCAVSLGMVLAAVGFIWIRKRRIEKGAPLPQDDYQHNAVNIEFD